MSKLPTFAYVLGGVLVVAYLIGLFVQFQALGATDLEWARRTELLSGLEALAFAAAGAILGTTVQRQATEKAEGRAERAEEVADNNAAAAAKGRALTAAVTAKRESVPQTAAAVTDQAAFQAGLEKELDELVKIAETAET